ncbi:helix-turn-helix transcriptional regulator [Ralstonia mojiangensis]|uniref:helix-turn-helix transcriptional regulator n=1 Tax=Ralstonia mojiangensis TaxID=2953895 RepID=UPI00370938AA
MRPNNPSPLDTQSDLRSVAPLTLRARLLRLPQVVELVGVKKSTIWKWASEGAFPRPLKLSKGVTVWRAADVLEWIEERSKLSR